MNAIKQVRRYLRKYPNRDSSELLARLTAALAEEREFPLAELYALDLEAFELALDLMRDWRLDRYYAARIKLFDTVLAEVLPNFESGATGSDGTGRGSASGPGNRAPS